MAPIRCRFDQTAVWHSDGTTAQISAFRPIKSGTYCIGVSLGSGARDRQETFGRASQIGHTVLQSTTAPADALSSHQRSRKRVPEPDRRRALELLASSPDGCTEAILRAHGFSTAQIVDFVHAGLASAPSRRVIVGVGGRRIRRRALAQPRQWNVQPRGSAH